MEVYETKTPPTAEISANFFKETFSRFGLPEMLVTDNGTHFTGKEVKKLCTKNGIVHRFTAPHHPATNGLAERAVQLFKKKLEQLQGEPGTLKNKIIDILVKYRTTPHETTGKTPSEMLFNRNVRTKLDLLKQKEEPKGSNNFSQNGFKPGQKVIYRVYDNRNEWKCGEVTRRLGKLHYLIKGENGEIKRHRNQMQQTEIKIKPETHRNNFWKNFDDPGGPKKQEIQQKVNEPSMQRPKRKVKAPKRLDL